MLLLPVLHIVKNSLITNIQKSILYELTDIQKNIFKCFLNSHSGFFYILKHKNYMNSCKF